MSSQFYLKQMELGPMHNYVYLVGDTETGQALVVDPAWDVEAIRKQANIDNMAITGMLITHGHPDHTNGINELLRTHDIPVYVSKDEASFYKPVGKNIKDVRPGDTLNIGHTPLTFLHTPGHTPGSQCFLVHNHLISGDTLFLDGCGRCDLPGGNAETMYHTITQRLMKLPDTTIIYPGHNYHHLQHDTLGQQKKTNPYMTCANLQEFLRDRMGY